MIEKIERFEELSTSLDQRLYALDERFRLLALDVARLQGKYDTISEMVSRASENAVLRVISELGLLERKQEE